MRIVREVIVSSNRKEIAKIMNDSRKGFISPVVVRRDSRGQWVISQSLSKGDLRDDH